MNAKEAKCIISVECPKCHHETETVPDLSNIDFGDDPIEDAYCCFLFQCENCGYTEDVDFE